MNNKIQLIGAFTKIGPAVAIPMFKTVQNILEKRGWEVHNPTEMMAPDTEWGKAMEITLSNLPKMDAVYVIQNWTISDGSLLEVKEAIILGLKIYNKHNQPKIIKS